MYDIRSAMLNIGIVFTPGKFKINLEKTWKTPGILVNLRSTDPDENKLLPPPPFVKFSLNFAEFGAPGTPYRVTNLQLLTSVLLD